MTISSTVRLAAVVYQSGFKIDDFLTRLANLLHADQIKVAGVLQENARDVAGFCSAMTLVDLTSREPFPDFPRPWIAGRGLPARCARNRRNRRRCSSGRSIKMSN